MADPSICNITLSTDDQRRHELQLDVGQLVETPDGGLAVVMKIDAHYIGVVRVKITMGLPDQPLGAACKAYGPKDLAPARLPVPPAASEAVAFFCQDSDPDGSPATAISGRSPVTVLVTCIRCGGRPAALVGDLLPGDQLCCWCRADDSPTATASFLVSHRVVKWLRQLRDVGAEDEELRPGQLVETPDGLGVVTAVEPQQSRPDYVSVLLLSQRDDALFLLPPSRRNTYTPGDLSPARLPDAPGDPAKPST